MQDDALRHHDYATAIVAASGTVGATAAVVGTTLANFPLIVVAAGFMGLAAGLVYFTGTDRSS